MKRILRMFGLWIVRNTTPYDYLDPTLDALCDIYVEAVHDKITQKTLRKCHEAIRDYEF